MHKKEDKHITGIVDPKQEYKIIDEKIDAEEFDYQEYLLTYESSFKKEKKLTKIEFEQLMVKLSELRQRATKKGAPSVGREIERILKECYLLPEQE